MLSFIIPGKPVGKGRPRFWNGRVVTPKATRDFEELVAWTAREAGAKPLETPCEVVVEFVMTPPTSWSKKKRLEALGGQHFPPRPDIDNGLKIILDGLNSVAFRDDKQIWKVYAQKYYGKEAYTNVTIIYDM